MLSDLPFAGHPNETQSLNHREFMIMRVMLCCDLVRYAMIDFVISAILGFFYDLACSGVVWCGVVRCVTLLCVMLLVCVVRPCCFML